MIKDRLATFKNPAFIFWMYIIVVLVASVHRYLLGIDHVNNYMIFKFSFLNLWDNKDLYIVHSQYNDLYKYSPTFALLMAPFSMLPVLPGLILWNLLNALSLFIAIRMLPVSQEKKTIAWYLVFLELLTSVQNSQSNGLMAGLLLMAFVSLERKNMFLAALLISLSFYIKVFGVVAAILFLMYPGRIKFILYMTLSMVLMFFMPLLVIPIEQLFSLYKSWFFLLGHDASHSLNFSVMTLSRTWFGINIKDIYFQLPGLILLALPLIYHKAYKFQEFRILFFSSILIWVIIFNHKAESPTFVIALLGIALWYITSLGAGYKNGLLLLAFILTSLSPTDIFPKFVRDEFIVPYVLKVLPCVLIWIRIQMDLQLRRWEVSPVPAC